MLKKRLNKYIIAPLTYLIFSSTYAFEDRSISENIRFDQRIGDLEKNLLNPKVEIKPQHEYPKIDLKNIHISESPCFKVKKIQYIIEDPLFVQNDPLFNFLFYKLNQNNLIIGQCIGTRTLQNIVRYAQNELIKKGYITSQVIVNPQDINQGLLVFNLRIGRINQIISRDQTVSKLEIFNAFPITKNDILNLTQIDQGLENLKSVAGRDIDIHIEPALSADGQKIIGYSDLIISSHPGKRVEFNLGMDDSGYKTTGRYQGNLGISLNEPFKINDTLNINVSHSLDNWNKDLNKSYYINYSVPFKNYSLASSYNQYIFEQNTPGFYGPIKYKGQSTQANLTLTHLISRNSNYKTALYTKVYHKKTRNMFGGIDLVSQSRTTTGWNLGLQHHQYIGKALLDINIDYRKGTGALNAKPAPEEKIVDIYNQPLPVEGYARAPLWTADLRYSQPLTILNEPVQYRLGWHGQYAPKILVPQDRFYIAGRYSVRGFDGELSLSGDNGHYLQQELNWKSPIPSTQFFAGLDQGWVNGKNSIPGDRYLMGSVLGSRSFYKGIYLETFIGHGLVSPRFLKKQWVSGFNINFSY